MSHLGFLPFLAGHDEARHKYEVFGNPIMTSVLSTIFSGLLLLTIVSSARAESLSFQLGTFADGHFSIENRGNSGVRSDFRTFTH
ncbi:MAG TPA: hypothetical protein DEQ20_09290 [Desulfobulbaceae bacterium]|nr:MAG: hypothetical protein A2520_07275 [Deltaproteobacteria bacterium RIFOXYD12_FULL_53_23]HCC55095.1 hypothetical protein [Desulfobulbaceae bacterium]